MTTIDVAALRAVIAAEREARGAPPEQDVLMTIICSAGVLDTLLDAYEERETFRAALEWIEMAGKSYSIEGARAVARMALRGGAKNAT